MDSESKVELCASIDDGKQERLSEDQDHDVWFEKGQGWVRLGKAREGDARLAQRVDRSRRKLIHIQPTKKESALLRYLPWERSRVF